MEFILIWRSLARHFCLYLAVLARSTAPLLLLPSVLQPASAPATPEGPSDAQVQSRRFHPHRPHMPIYRSAAPGIIHMGTLATAGM